MDYVAFTDGSYKERSPYKLYASAAIFSPIGTTDWTVLKSVGNDPDYIRHRNVAGEVLAVIQLCDHLLTEKDSNGEPYKVDKLIINYDYAGIEKWPTFGWKKANTELSRMYRAYMTKIAIPQLHIEFRYTRGHSGITGNELVDQIAHRLIDQKLEELISKDA